MELLSKYLNLGNKLDENGTLDRMLDLDIGYFINIKRLKDTKEKCFVNSYAKIQKYFSDIYSILSSTNDRNSIIYREAVKRFDFHEKRNLGLGYSKSINGKGFGIKLSKQIINDAKDIIDAGIENIEIFHLVGLFEENVGPDRLSDMYSNIIYEDILNYTKEVNDKLGITKENYPEQEFKNGFLINPYTGKEVLLVPKDIVHELPIAKEWEDIDSVCSMISCIKSEINKFVGDEWKKASSKEKKEFVKNKIMKEPFLVNEIINEYNNFNLASYDFDKDELGYYKIAKEINDIKLEELSLKGNESPVELVMKICSKFKDLIENNGLSRLLYNDDKTFRNEKAVQLLFYGIAESYCEAFNLDISPESNSGRGCIDFKFSKGYKERIVVEIKLVSNQQLVHGFKTQLNEYGKAEKTDKLIYIVIDNHKHDRRLKNFYNEFNASERKPKLFVVDAEIKVSASIYSEK